MPRPLSIQPPEVVAIVGSRNASMYDLCPECGRVKAKKARTCWDCYSEK